MSKLYQKINGSAVPLSGGVGVINNLNSTSTEDALSANMGKELKEEVDEINTNLAQIIKIKKYVGTMPNSISDISHEVYSAGNITVIGASAYNKRTERFESLPIAINGNSDSNSYIASFKGNIRLYITNSQGLTDYDNQQVIVYYIENKI